jgi:CheY-like chemotaxis protein
LTKAREGKPDLILLDIIMRVMDGMQMLEELENDPSIKNIPVVVLTNLTKERAAEKMLGLGAVKYIVKSEHDPSEVVDIVNEILAGYTRDEIPKTKQR